jgi:serine/threonine protein kinase
MSHPAALSPASPPTLAGVACCEDLAAEEILGPPLEDELPAGYLLDGRFLLGPAVGRSGMATIYRARDQADGRPVAVKIPLRRIESDPVSFGRFQREERIGAALRDPQLLEFVRVANKSRPYLVTEFLEGSTLAQVLHGRCPLPEADALRIASVVCEPLRHLHARGFVHRDLKPANIMIRRDRTLCLMDFGLAAEAKARAGLLAGLVPLFGTPEYMAPEQVRNRANDARTDIYSLGVILYQMLTGALPFPDEDPWVSAHRRVSGDPVAPRTLNPALTPQAEEIVLAALARRPADRYATVDALQADLMAPSRVHVTGRSQRLRAPRWRLSLQGTPLAAGALIGLGALAFFGALFLLLSRHR